MKICSMTATFGKLEQQTLTLESGLNIIAAPNEWGKSTWCAFLIAMLYGLDTRARTTAAALADKEHYAPWSGRSMEGRIDLIWQERVVTIERRTKGRVPMGVFRAYETDTGLDIPELTAANCGQMLLGVERSVFVRSGFLRLGDLPVTQDEALRRRLNALVTTGDESNAADRLSGKLKDLKNRCRHNRTGLLPEAQAGLARIESQKTRLEAVREQLAQLEPVLAQTETELAALQNHADALRYAKAQADAGRVAAACAVREQELSRLRAAEHDCKDLPSLHEAQKTLAEFQQYRERRQALEDAVSALPEPPEAPEPPKPFRGMRPGQAQETAQADTRRYEALTEQANRAPFPVWMAAVCCLVAGIGLRIGALPGWQLGLAAAIVLTAVSTVLQVRAGQRRREALAQAAAISEKYAGGTPEQWLRLAKQFAQDSARYDREMEQYRARRAELARQLAKLDADARPITGGQAVNGCLQFWQHVLSARQDWDQARRAYESANSYAENLQAMARAAQPPAAPDSLTCSMDETREQIAQKDAQLRRLHSNRDQLQGQLAAMESPQALEAQASALKARIWELEKTNMALTYALDALEAARQELQRRFAPRIKERAQVYFSRLTGGRYDRVSFDQDLSLSAGGQAEAALRSPLWRSDGTADQLYLALRLAMAEELTPDTPLVLDDVFARFDRNRLQAAMEILRELAETRQVILFSCHDRENG